MPVGHHRGAERVGLDDRSKVVALDHSYHPVNQIFGGPVSADIHVNLVAIPEKFISQELLQPRADLLRQSDGINRLLPDAIMQCRKSVLGRLGPEVDRAVPDAPDSDCGNKRHRTGSVRIRANDNLIETPRFFFDKGDDLGKRRFKGQSPKRLAMESYISMSHNWNPSQKWL
mgnify:CR=1 FL=1